MPEGHFAPLPLQQGDDNVNRHGRFIDIEVLGTIVAAGGVYDNITITNATIDNATITNADIDALSFDRIVGATNTGEDLTLGTGTSITIGSGGVVRSATSGLRYELSALSSTSGINFYSGHASETFNGYFGATLSGANATMYIAAPTITGGTSSVQIDGGSLTLASTVGNSLQLSTTTSVLYSYADSLYLQANFGAGGSNKQILVSCQSPVGTVQGSASNPAIAATGDINTGFYWPAADQLFVAAGGLTSGIFKTSATAISTGILGAFGAANTSALGGTSGNLVYVSTQGGSVTDNQVYLDTLMLRTATGTAHTDMSIGLQRRTDTTNQSSLWFDNSGVGIGISDPDSYKTLTVNGTVALKPGSGSGTNAHLVSLGSSYYEVVLDTSARRFKTDIADAAHLADAELRPVTFKWRETGDSDIGFIAEDVIEALGYDAGNYDDDGDVLNFKDRAVLAMLVAKVNRLEEKVNI